MGDRTVVAGDRGDVALVGLHAVDEQRPVREDAERVEQRDGARGARAHRDAAPGESVGEGAGALADETAFGVALGDVNRHGERLGAGVRGNGAEKVVGYGVGRVRGDAEPDEWGRVRPRPFELGPELRHGAVEVLGGRAEGLGVHDAADAHLVHGDDRGAGVAGVGVRGDAREQSFGDAEPRGVEVVVRRHHRVLGRLERQNPLAEGQVLEEAAEGGELEMGVGVDEPGHQDRVAKVLVAAGGRARRRPDPGDAAVLDRDAGVLERGCRDREHPPGVVADRRAG